MRLVRLDVTPVYKVPFLLLARIYTQGCLLILRLWGFVTCNKTKKRHWIPVNRDDGGGEWPLNAPYDGGWGMGMAAYG